MRTRSQRFKNKNAPSGFVFLAERAGLPSAIPEMGGFTKTKPPLRAAHF
jgi:hypothetical protein